jgi:hypothetical protein
MSFHKLDDFLNFLQNRWPDRMPVYEIGLFQACPPEPEPPDVPDINLDELPMDRRTLWEIMELLVASMMSDDSS